MKKTVFGLVAAGALVVAIVASAQEPAVDIGGRHGNLRAAQELVQQAFDRLTAAQEANEFDLGGHAGRAKELLRQANDEMKLAAMTANNH